MFTYALHKKRAMNFCIQHGLWGLFLVTLASPSCKAADEYEEGDKTETQAVKDEPDDAYGQKLPGWGPGPFGAYPLVPALKGGSLMDLRGVGDTSWAKHAKADPMEKGLADALRAFNRDGTLLRSDLTFVNFESAVGASCGKWSGSQFKFISHPQAIFDLAKAGVQLFALANNHSEDCARKEDESSLKSSPESPSISATTGAQATAQNMSEIKKQLPGIVWHGVTQQPHSAFEPAIQTFNIRGNAVRVAFASVFLGWDCSYAACNSRVKNILLRMASSPAQLKVLSIHTQGMFPKLKETAREAITSGAADVVWGHGPHTWAGVELFPGSDGKTGIAFYSLGNFIHPSLAAQRENLLGRIIWDVAKRRPVQVQAIPLATNGALAHVYEAPLPVPPKSNMRWQQTTLVVEGKKAQVFYAHAPQP